MGWTMWPPQGGVGRASAGRGSEAGARPLLPELPCSTQNIRKGVVDIKIVSSATLLPVNTF